MTYFFKMVRDYLQTKLPVTISGLSSMASCDSDCPSVPELASVDEVSVCLQVFTNMIALKSLAKCFMYPGLPVSATNSSAAAYYCFHYLSASAVISVNYTKIHQILDDAVCMKYVS
jgi:hypothetical protein